MSGRSESGGGDQRRAFAPESHLRAQYRLAVVCVIALAVTGLPQKFESLALFRQAIDLAGGIETLRFIHHVAGGALVLTGVYHVALVLATILVFGQTGLLRMIPSATDVRDAVNGTAYLLRLGPEPPDGRGRQYVQKLDYWFVAWSLGVMGVTGLINLMPLRLATVMSTDAVLASLRTHSDAAPLVMAWVLIVHLPYMDVTPRMFRVRAGNANAARPAAGTLEVPVRTAGPGTGGATSVTSSAERRLAELHAKDREGSL